VDSPLSKLLYLLPYSTSVGASVALGAIIFSFLCAPLLLLLRGTLVSLLATRAGILEYSTSPAVPVTALMLDASVLGGRLSQ